MKILVTGNMGYIGPVVVRQLRESYPEAFVAGFDMGYFGNCLTSSEMLPECRVDVQYFGDVRKFPKHLLKDVQAVVQLAAISNDPMGNMFEQVTYDVNYRATIHLAKLAKAAGADAFVFPSSCSVYGVTDGSVKREVCPLNPLTAYAKSKVMAEQDLAALATNGFTVTCLRFATACGMSDRLRLDLVLNDFVASALACGRITVLSDGTPWRPLIHVRDMARAIDWAIRRNGHAGGNFLAVNTGSNDLNYQVKDLAEAVAGLISNSEVSINKNAPPDRRSYQVSFDLFEGLAPDYQPEVNLTRAVVELRTALERMEFKDKDFRDSHLARLAVLRSLQQKGLLTEALEWSKHGNCLVNKEESKSKERSMLEV